MHFVVLSVTLFLAFAWGALRVKERLVGWAWPTEINLLNQGWRCQWLSTSCESWWCESWPACTYFLLVNFCWLKVGSSSPECPCYYWAHGWLMTPRNDAAMLCDAPLLHVPHPKAPGIIKLRSSLAGKEMKSYYRFSSDFHEGQDPTQCRCLYFFFYPVPQKINANLCVDFIFVHKGKFWHCHTLHT